ncbi:unnamed protein product, partial [marine sediment metagenome]
DVETADADIVWSYSTLTNLTVSIVAQVATIGVVDGNWNGSELITFTATDEGALFASDDATFTVTGVNDPPVVGDIPSETIAEGGTFATISLDGYVTDVETADADIVWSYSTLTNLTVSIVAQVATIGVVDGNWNGSELITFTATDEGTLFASDDATFTVTGVNDPPVVGDIPSETIAEGGTFATISLDGYVTDVETADADIVWSYSTLTNLTVSIVAQVATIGVVDGNWNGSELITFTATDEGTLFASDDATFTVTGVNDPPVVGDIPSETIAEGGTFATIS